MVFTHPLKKKYSYIRIRYEGTHISLTSKINLKSEFVTEYEVKINNFAQGLLNILKEYLSNILIIINKFIIIFWNKNIIIIRM
jgi:hypothetical protein